MKDRSEDLLHATQRRKEEDRDGGGPNFPPADLSTKRLLLMSLLWPSRLETGDLMQLAAAAISLFEIEAKHGTARKPPMQ